VTVTSATIKKGNLAFSLVCALDITFHSSPNFYKVVGEKSPIFGW